MPGVADGNFHRTVFAYSCANNQKAFFLPDFGERIHFHPVVSLPDDDAGAAWSGETGYVHELVRRTFGDAMAGHEFYFAGPPPMTQGLQEMLMVEFRVPFGQVHFDRFF